MSEYCTCVPSRTRGWSLDYVRQWWVCTDCHKPSKAIYLLRLSDPSAKV